MILISKKNRSEFARQAIQGVVTAAYLIFTTGSLFGLTAVFGRWAPTFDVLAQLAPLFAMSGIVGLALALCGRRVDRKRRSLIAAIGALGCGFIAAPEALSRIAAPASLTLRNPGEPLRVVEINSGG